MWKTFNFSKLYEITLRITKHGRRANGPRTNGQVTAPMIYHDRNILHLAMYHNRNVIKNVERAGSYLTFYLWRLTKTYGTLGKPTVLHIHPLTNSPYS